MKNKLLFIILASMTALCCSGCSIFGIGSEEKPSYEVIVGHENKEIRRYNPSLIAKTIIKGSFKEAQNKGFGILAGYIFGENVSQQKISMTAPVVQKPESQKIAMTAPVAIIPQDDETWTMTFSMPSAYTIDSLPLPTDDRVIIEKLEERYIAAIRFSGFWGEQKNAQKAAQLIEWLGTQSEYELTSKPMFAGYNPPWTLPFFRRNEMLIELRLK
jgi:hypothetical protein